MGSSRFGPASQSRFWQLEELDIRKERVHFSTVCLFKFWEDSAGPAMGLPDDQIGDSSFLDCMFSIPGGPYPGANGSTLVDILTRPSWERNAKKETASEWDS